jgi:acyl-CoA reductase-like NAD-dependent aldehyde dehydrogenase
VTQRRVRRKQPRSFEPRAEGMRTGNVTMNGKSLLGITSPFGGTKQSGPGRRNGTDGFEEYLGSKPSAYPTETTTVDVQEISD